MLRSLIVKKPKAPDYEKAMYRSSRKSVKNQIVANRVSPFKRLRFQMKKKGSSLEPVYKVALKTLEKQDRKGSVRRQVQRVKSSSEMFRSTKADNFSQNLQSSIVFNDKTMQFKDITDKLVRNQDMREDCKVRIQELKRLITQQNVRLKKLDKSERTMQNEKDLVQSWSRRLRNDSAKIQESLLSQRKQIDFIKRQIRDIEHKNEEVIDQLSKEAELVRATKEAIHSLKEDIIQEEKKKNNLKKDQDKASKLMQSSLQDLKLLQGHKAVNLLEVLDSSKQARVETE